MTGPATFDPFKGNIHRSVSLIEIHTDAKIIGLGETYAGYFCPDLIPSIVEFFKPILVGQTADDVDELFNRMYHCGNFWCRVGLGLSVLNGIEAALWDLKGKVENKPVYELLGGTKHESLPTYASGGPSNYPLDALVSKIELYVEHGFNRIKIGAGGYDGKTFEISNDPNEAADFEASKLDFLRNRFGRDFNLMMDAHMSNSPITWNLKTAQSVMKAVAPFGLSFFEEPLHYNDRQGYTELCKNTEVPIAGGECLTGTWEWDIFIEQDCFDIGQPDASFTGGMRQCQRIAESLAKRNRQIATHSWGAGASLLQNIHLAFACPNTSVVEMDPILGPLHTEMMRDSFRFKNGRVLPPQTPGLGITLTEEMKRRFPFVPGSGEFNNVPGKTNTIAMPMPPCDKS